MLDKTHFFDTLIDSEPIGIAKEMPMLEETTKYWIYMSGGSDAAVLFDRSPKEGGKPVLWLRSDSDKAESAEGLNLGMLLQDMGQPRMVPPDFSCTGTEKEALTILKRENAVADCGVLLFTTVLDDEVPEPLAIECLQEVERLISQQEDVLRRINELGFIPKMLQALNTHQGDEGAVRLRNYLISAQTSRITKLFFGY